MLTRRSMLRLAGLAPLALAHRAHAQTATDAEWKRVIDAAKKEGKVSMYTGAVGSPATDYKLQEEMLKTAKQIYK